jgi:hypothetical protein
LGFLLDNTSKTFSLVNYFATIFDHKAVCDYVFVRTETHSSFSDLERPQLRIVSSLKPSVAALVSRWACFRVAFDIAQTIQTGVATARSRHAANAGGFLIFVSLVFMRA